MSERPLLRGMAWDHPRARNPLEAIAAQWSTERGVRVQWEARPLKYFEDQPLEELATAYDLVLIDYPFVGTAARSGLITPVDSFVDAAYLADQAAHSVGPSYASYTWAGRQWALAIDAACQVSAVREDIWSAGEHGSLPDSWPDVAQLARRTRSAASRVAMALNPNHAYCAFLAVGVCLAGMRFWPTGSHVDRPAAEESLEFLRRLATQVHPASRDADPIAISDRMTRCDEILYVPLMFGYSSYARRGFRAHVLRFANAPRGPSGIRGSVLGGVGLALSARSQQCADAADLAREIASSDAQSGIYAQSGGQPGHAAAWDSSSVNAQTGDFFRATRATIDQAFMRPRVPGHRQFQPLAGERIHRFIWGEQDDAGRCVADFSRLADSLLADRECRAVV
jgi:multiple sugar transport system substrate-binding protein